MNDPGLDDSIEKEAEAIENEAESAEREEAEEDEQSFLAPSRWWFASTAFPLIAGTFGPMASAFSICALVVPWRVSIPDGSTEASGTYVDDPSWLIGINATQLAIALISNLFLLLNMARRVRFSIAQPVTIIGWYISSFTLVGLAATAVGPLQIQSPPDHSLSQAFYYAAFAAGLYFIVASLMMTTVVGAHMGLYEKEFKLTMSQRTLMLQTISFLIYLLTGAMVFAHIEGWSFLDAVYFTDFTLLTVGVGDIAPTTDLARGLLFPYAIGGIIILGLAIGSIRSLVLDRGKIKLGARIVEKERELLLKRIQRKSAAVLVPVNREMSGQSRASSSHTGYDEDLNERKRREMEFNLMRKVQERAAARRRWTSLAVSGSTWFALWFAGAAVFQATETSQQWTYFTSLYFSYTSLLTIGYGDISPVSNAGKPFFVFWSLLAVPSLTILISNMGDTIVKMIRDLTLWIGNITVLPGENGIRKGMKEAVRTVSCSKVFSEKIGETPPGILGEMDDKYPDDDDEQEGGKTGSRSVNPSSAAQRVANGQADLEAKQAKQQGETSDTRAIPESKPHYHSLLIQEINKVMRHLKSNPPRKYTFDEWAWYLKLIGEDESSPDTHREAIMKPKPDKGPMGTNAGQDMGESRKIKWSWVGHRSPLMANQEEAEWVLERLTKKLGRELEVMKREVEEGTGDWREDGMMSKLPKNHGRKESIDGQSRDGWDQRAGRSGPSDDTGRSVVS